MTDDNDFKRGLNSALGAMTAIAIVVFSVIVTIVVFGSMLSWKLNQQANDQNPATSEAAK